MLLLAALLFTPIITCNPTLMDNLHYRLTFDLDNKNEISGKNLLKKVKFQNLVEKCVEDTTLQGLQIFSLSYYV